jgi:hypothetical protein
MSGIVTDLYLNSCRKRNWAVVIFAAGKNCSGETDVKIHYSREST